MGKFAFCKLVAIFRSEIALHMTPLVLIVGFLGAGKTTFLRGLVDSCGSSGIKPYVVLNDFQNARVDAELFREIRDMVKPISGSCVCCGSRDELVEAISAAPAAPDRVVLVETNGTTDAEELIDFLSSEPRLRRFTLPIQVALVDAKRWQKRFWHNDLERSQVRTATHCVISRQDQADEERVAAVRSSVLNLQPSVLETNARNFGESLQDLLKEVGKQDHRHLSSGQTEHAHEHDHPHGHGEHHHHEERHHFASAEFQLPAEINRADLETFLRALPKGILRAKGVVRFRHEPSVSHLFQYVDEYETLTTTPLADGASVQEPLMILIGPGSDAPEVAAELRRLLC